VRPRAATRCTTLNLESTACLMRPFALLSLLLALASLVGARYLPQPGFLMALYALALFASLFAIALLGAGLEALSGAHYRAAAAVAGAALAAASAAYASTIGAPGILPAGRPLELLGAKALSISMLSATLGGAVLCLAGLRAISRGFQALAGIGLAASAFSAATTAQAFGLPVARPGLIAAVLAAGLLYLAWARRAPQGN